MKTPALSKHHISQKASLFAESVIREMTRESLKLRSGIFLLYAMGKEQYESRKNKLPST